MMSTKCILLAGASLLLLPASFGVAQISSLPDQDRRVTRIRHLNMPYTFQPFSTKEAWSRRAKYLRRQILVSAGLWPPMEKSPLNAQVFGKISREGYSIEKVYFESHPGFFVTGNLYRPLGREGLFPGILSPHGHWTYGRLENQVLGSVPGRCINLALQGYVVFSYDMLGYNDSRQIKDHRRMMDRRFSLWGIGLLGLQLWNSIRSVDFLESLPDVDQTRLGCTGGSGGGTQTFLLTAVDDRIKVSAPVNMISHYMQGGSICENQPNLRLDTNNMEIAALMAPRPLLMVSASGDWTRETPRVEFPAVQSIYRLYGAADKVQTMQTFAVHNYNRESREAVYAWFGKWMLGENDGTKFSEKSIRLGTPSEFLVFFGRELPQSALSEEQLMESLIDSYQRQVERLQPEDSTTLARFREIMKPALKHSLAVHYPEAAEVMATPSLPDGRGQGQRLVIGRKNRGDRVPAVLWFPRRRRKTLTATLLLHPQGKKALHSKASLLVQSLLDQGQLVMSIDAFNTGTATAKRDMSDRFFTTYNRTDDSNRVQDILTALAYLQTRPEVTRISLAGLERAGLWCLLARSLAPGLHRIAVDVSRFNPEEDRAYLEALYIPLLRRVGDFKTASMLAPATPLLIHNTGESFDTTWLQRAYRIAGKTALLEVHSNRISQAGLAFWLTEGGL